MMLSDRNPAGAGTGRVLRLALLFVAELIALAMAYQFLAQIECQATGAQGTCEFLKRMVVRALVMLAVVAILIRARPAAFATFLDRARRHGGATARWVHLAGLVLLMLPLVMAWGQDLGAQFGRAVYPLAFGGMLAAGGGLLWVAPRAAWGQLLLRDGRAVLPALLFAFVVPDLTDLARPLWDWQVLTRATFTAVGAILGLFATGVQADAQNYVIGLDPFFVHIARQCSGVEGFALVTAFVGLYAVVFARDVRLGRVLLVLLPFGIALSWGLNVLRIAVLILLGARLSPEVAVNGFHSYAGWLFFTLLAFMLIWAAQRLRWLHRDAGPRAPAALPLRADPVAAMIVPFVAFMVAGTFLSAVFPVPGIGFPLTTLVLIGAAGLFLPVWRQMTWRPDAVSVAVGAVVGLGWLFTAPAPDLRLEAMVAEMPMAIFAVWAALRIAGTAVLVPLIEEMFFRGYVLARVAGQGAIEPLPLWRVLAGLGLSSLLFAALHGRWVEAGLAGLAFGLIALRRGRVTDAVWAHAVANAIVAGAALLQREWSLI